MAMMSPQKSFQLFLVRGNRYHQVLSPYELFKNEVKILPKLQHNNIVKLKGFCAERSERVSVY
jgi:serine/threonine protein kinase